MREKRTPYYRLELHRRMRGERGKEEKEEDKPGRQGRILDLRKRLRLEWRGI